jgi:hypothetical protein
MTIIIQCAARKNRSAGSLRTADGREVLFVAQPDLAPPEAIRHYARPDDLSDDGRTWRERLVALNAAADNPLNLLQAYRLYAHDAYRALADRFGLGRVFILSAGWGLISANFLTPDYDITFTASADDWKRRRKGDHYEDLCMLTDDDDPIVFVGGKDYLPLFRKLMARYARRRSSSSIRGQSRTCHRDSRRSATRRPRAPTGIMSARGISPPVRSGIRSHNPNGSSPDGRGLAARGTNRWR